MQFLYSCLNCLTKNFPLAWVISSTIFSILFHLFTQVFKSFQQLLYLPSEDSFNKGSSQNSLVIGIDSSNESHYCVFLTLFDLQLNFTVEVMYFTPPKYFFLIENEMSAAKSSSKHLIFERMSIPILTLSVFIVINNN